MNYFGFYVNVDGGCLVNFYVVVVYFVKVGGIVDVIVCVIVKNDDFKFVV